MYNYMYIYTRERERERDCHHFSFQAGRAGSGSCAHCCSHIIRICEAPQQRATWATASFQAPIHKLVLCCLFVSYVYCLSLCLSPDPRTEGSNPKLCHILRSLFIPRSHKPRSFESKFRKRCTKKLYGALRTTTLYV